MKIISYDNARVTWLFPLEEFTPAAGSDGLHIIAQIGIRYGFATLPQVTTREQIQKNGLPFSVGRFVIDGSPIIINDFIVYTDGLAAVAEKTEWADKFLEDVFDWVTEQFGFRELSSEVRRLYQSTLVADFDHSPSKLLFGYERLVELISSRVSTTSLEPKPLQFSRLDFEVDRTLAGGQVFPKFILERRGGVGFKQERYFSVAPMRTHDHVEVLSQIEILTASAAEAK